MKSRHAWRAIFTATLLVLSVAVGAARASNAHDLFDPGTDWSQLGFPGPTESACSYRFAWGRGSVTVENAKLVGKSHCRYSHMETTEIPPSSLESASTVYLQFYTCDDGTSAFYSTNWFGGNFSFWHRIGPAQTVMKCI